MYLKCKLEWLTGPKDAKRIFRVKFNGWISEPMFKDGDRVRYIVPWPMHRLPAWLLIEQEGRVDEVPQGPHPATVLLAGDSIHFTLHL